MKKQIILVLILAITATQLIAQLPDYIVTGTGRKIDCKITRISADTVYFGMYVDNRVTNTQYRRADITDIFLFNYNNLKSTHDTSAFYIVTLTDKMKLTGKISNIGNYTFTIDDNLLGTLNVRGELIESFDKELKGNMYHVVLVNGNEFTAKYVERRKNIVVFQTDALGQLSVATSDIRQMKNIKEENIKGGNYFFPNPNNTRYFFAPSAMNLKKGEGYYQNTYVIGNSVNYGLTDNFSIGAIVVLPSLVFITPKIGFRVADNFHLGGGVMAGIVPDLFDGNVSLAGIGYGVATYGTLEYNATLGTGMLYAEGEFFDRPIITLSGMARINKRLAFVSENWFLPTSKEVYYSSSGQYVMKNVYYEGLSYGLRFMWEKISLDFAFINNRDIVENMPIGIPYIDFVVKF